MRRRIFHAAVCLSAMLLLAGCGGREKSAADKPFPVESVTFGEGHYEEIRRGLIDSISFVPLEETETTYLSTISKVKVRGGRIFVFDKIGSNAVVSFDMEGRHAIRYGERGNGNAEYIRLADFDVDDDYVYLYDYAKMRLLLYRHTGEYVRARATDFRGKGVCVLANGGYLFAMEKEENLRKLCVVDSSMAVEKCLLTYSEEDVSDKWTDNFFQSCGETILYNAPVNDSIYMLSAEGEIAGCKVVDFNGHNVPAELKRSYERLTASEGKEKYTYFYDCPLLVCGTIVGSTFDRGVRSCVLHDLGKGIGGRNEWKEGMRLANLVLPLCATENCIMGWMDYGVYGFLADKGDVPKSVVAHMERGGRTLILYHR